MKNLKIPDLKNEFFDAVNSLESFFSNVVKRNKVIKQDKIINEILLFVKEAVHDSNNESIKAIFTFISEKIKENKNSLLLDN